MIRLYGIKACDTMKKAMRWLDEQHIAYQFIDYKGPGVAAGHLPDWLARAGWETLLNRRGLTWRKLDPEVRATITAERAAALMAAQPSLIKRPLLDTGNTLHVGFDPDTYTALFAGQPTLADSTAPALEDPQ